MMSTLVMKKLCGGLLLTGFICGGALAQQPYGTVTSPGTDSATGASPGGDTSSGTSGVPGAGQAAPMPGEMESGASGMGSSGTASPGASSASGMTSGASMTPKPELVPETPGAAGPSDADPYKPPTSRSRMSR